MSLMILEASLSGGAPLSSECTMGHRGDVVVLVHGDVVVGQHRISNSAICEYVLVAFAFAKHDFHLSDVLVDQAFFTSHVYVVNMLGGEEVFLDFKLLVVGCSLQAKSDSDLPQLERKSTWGILGASAGLDALKATD